MKLIATQATHTPATAQNYAEYLPFVGEYFVEPTLDSKSFRNDENPLEADLDGITRVDLHFPKFSDGRAFTQAVMLRKRAGYTGEIRATGDVLVDQLQQMKRTGFDAAVLREDQDIEVAQRQLNRFDGFYQTDAINTPAKQSKAQNAKTRYAQTTASYADKLKETQDLLRQAAIEHAGSITQANSLGAEDVVIAHLIRALRLDIPAFVLETGQLNPETLVLLDKFKADWGSNFTVYKPRQEAVVHFVAKEGEGAMYRSIALRKACCDLRKMEPLARALSGKSAWITGLRREQSGARAEVPLLDDAEQASKGRVKFNPLANWTWGEVWYYIELHQLAYNSLHDEHVPSVGCAPCTRAIAQGEDFRAGRWWWEDESAKECGLHVRKKSEQA